MKVEIAGLDELAARLGVTVEYVWTVLVRQAFIDSILCLAFVATVALMWMAVYRFRVQIEKGWHGSEEGLGAMIAVGAIVLVIATIMAFIALFVAPVGLLNPEYWALNKILSAVKK